MARKSKSEQMDSLHREALRNFDLAFSPIQYERAQCIADRRFYSIAGAQWEGPLGQQFENRPKFEVNKVHLAVIRIINDYRNNRIGAFFVSKDGKEADDLADTCAMLYRAAEQDSVANEAYDNSFEEAVGGGFGAWRLRNCYVDETDEDDDRQTVKIEPIYDADTTVFFDPQAKRQDKADAKFCFVLTSMSPEAYEQTYGLGPQSWEHPIEQYEFDWATPDLVWVAEYYVVEEKRATKMVYRTILDEEVVYTQEDFDNDEELEDRLAAVGTTLMREKKYTRRKVRKYILSGGGIVEDCGHIAGDQIPIVPCYGKRWVVDSIERCMGHVRLAKDPQRLKNMQLSKLGELSAMSSVEKPIFTPQQMAGHQNMWSEDNVADYPYLLLNTITDANGQEVAQGPLGYTKPPQVPPAMAALLQITETDMQDILGNQQQGEEMVSNVSGKAIEMIQTRLDMQSFIYISNFGKAKKRSAEIFLSMAKDVYVEEGREVKGVNEDGTAESMRLMTPVIGEASGGVEVENDLSQASFDVDVQIGPSSDSKRQATVRALTGMMTITQDPETLSVLGAMVMLNMEGEGVRDVRKFYRNKLIRMGAVEPTEKEAQMLAEEAQNQKPDPQAEFLMAEAQKAQANTGLAVANTEKAKADTARILSEIDVSQRQSAIDTARAINDLTRPQV